MTELLTQSEMIINQPLKFNAIEALFLIDRHQYTATLLGLFSMYMVFHGTKVMMSHDKVSYDCYCTTVII